ncbi:MAG: disulfide bond formation protein B [Leptothrix sp. (in: b-proteobacteria)]
MKLPIHPRAGLALIGLVCAASVGAALVAQHRFGMEPCPWCILQRILFIVIALLGLLGSVLPGQLPRLAAALMLPASLAGAAAALYQNLVASKLPSCDMTLADKIISGLGLDAWQPEVFEVRASCADAAVKVLGVPFELWSLALFGLIGGVAVLLARYRGPHHHHH